MSTLEKLAHLYADTSCGYQRRLLAAAALVNVDIDSFINEHKDGWIGDTGNFARTLARIREIV